MSEEQKAKETSDSVRDSANVRGIQEDALGKEVGMESSAKPPSNTKVKVVAGIIALVVLLAAAVAAYKLLSPMVAPQQPVAQKSASAASVSSAEEESVEAPDFTMTAFDGTEVSLSDFRGTPVVMNLWASNCGYCKQEMPEFQSAFDEYGDRIQFVMLDILGFNGETEQRGRRAIEDAGYDFPVFFDSTGRASVEYGVTSLPQTFFINANGEIELFVPGAVDGVLLDRGIEMIL